MCDLIAALTGIGGEGETVVLGGGGWGDDVTDGTGRVGGVAALVQQLNTVISA